MGYDAFVRCNCFELGKVKPFKYIKYVKAFPEYLELELPDEIKADKALAEQIHDEFYDWKWSACEHEDMELVSERLANISGMGALRTCVDWLNEDNEFQIIQNQLPQSNDGYMPIEYNDRFLNEFKEFLTREVNVYRLTSMDKNPYAFWSSSMKENKEYTLCENEDYKLCSFNGTFRIEKHNEIIFQSSKFVVDRIINRRFIFRDKRQKAESNIFFNLALFQKGNRHTLMYERERISMKNEFQYLYDIFVELVTASKKTGNPICWC